MIRSSDTSSVITSKSALNTRNIYSKQSKHLEGIYCFLVNKDSLDFTH
ncbi:MAG: hypothetical protein FWE05_06130 [Defluviitaleaceae bacterium]|nr:hypothetical protein [Defluviitaleaceae bacterium]